MSRPSGPWTYWPPALLDDFRKELGRLVENVFEPGTESQSFAPSVNVIETAQSIEVTMDLPGVQPADVQIEIKEGQLWVSGERKSQVEMTGSTVHRVERRFGQFSRIIPLIAAVDVDKVDARYSDGVLSISIPKSEAAKSRRIEIKS